MSNVYFENQWYKRIESFDSELKKYETELAIAKDECFNAWIPDAALYGYTDNSLHKDHTIYKEKLKPSIDSFIKDNLTGCYNHIFLKEYLINEIDLITYDTTKKENSPIFYPKRKKFKRR